MHKLLILSLTATVTVQGLLCLAAAGEVRGRSRHGQSVELVIQYDLYGIEKTTIPDASGNKNHGTLTDGEVVYGRDKNAIRFNGAGSIVVGRAPQSLDLSSRPFTVGTLCQPAAADGVLIAIGDEKNGFSLYLKGGIPHFAVRSDGVLSQAVAAKPLPMNQWAHLAGSIDDGGRIRLMKNGWEKGLIEGRLIKANSTEPLAVGADLGSPVGEYTSPMYWRGLVQDTRIYWGNFNRNEYPEQWKDWADPSRCGCGR